MLLARAAFDNAADSPDELSFTQGDVLVVLEQTVPNMAGWWLCSFHGRIGLVPGNRLRLSLAAEDEEDAAAAASGGGMVHSRSLGDFNTNVKRSEAAFKSSRPTSDTATQPRTIPVSRVSATVAGPTVNSQHASGEQADYDIPSNKPLFRPGPPRNMDPAMGLKMPIYGSSTSNSVNNDYDSPSSRLAPTSLDGSAKVPGYPGSAVSKDPGYPEPFAGKVPRNQGTRQPVVVESQSLPGRGHKGASKSVTFSPQLTQTNNNDVSQSAYKNQVAPPTINPDSQSGNSSTYDSLPPQKNFNRVTYDSLPHRTLFAHHNGRLLAAEPVTLTLPTTSINRSSRGNVRIKDANSDYDTLRNMLVSVEEEYATTASNLSNSNNAMRGTEGAARVSVAVVTKQQQQQQLQEDAAYDIPRPYSGLSESILTSSVAKQQSNPLPARRNLQQQQTSIDRQSTYDIPPLVYSTPSAAVAATPPPAPATTMTVSVGEKTSGKNILLPSMQTKLVTVNEQDDAVSRNCVKTTSDALSSNCDTLLEGELSSSAINSAPSALVRVHKISIQRNNNDREKRLGVRVSSEQPIGKDVTPVIDGGDQSQLKINHQLDPKVLSFDFDVNSNNELSQTAPTDVTSKPASILKQLDNVILTDSDRQLLTFYRGHVSVNVASLAGACHNLQATLRDRKLLKPFVARCKCVIMRAHTLLYIADTVTRNVLDNELCQVITDTSNGLCEHVRSMVLSTKLVAAQYSPATLQTLVDNSQAVLDTSQRFSSIFRLVDD